MHSQESLEEWNRLIKDINLEDLYVAGTCALMHSLDLDFYATGQIHVNTQEHVSILLLVHASGSIKSKIAVSGSYNLGNLCNIASLPVNYYHSHNSKIDIDIVESHLKELDEQLKVQGKNILLAIGIPNISKQFNLSNIQVINLNVCQNYVSHILTKVVNCFKYHYRRLLITKKIEFGKDLHLEILDYIQMMSLAWYNVPSACIQSIFHPEKKGSLYLSTNKCEDENHSLLEWCEKYNVQIHLDAYHNYLDQYISCDSNYKSFECSNANSKPQLLDFDVIPQLTSGMEAYQAMKRLVSYLQGQTAHKSVIEAARNLENHLEYTALKEIHHIVNNTHQDTTE